MDILTLLAGGYGTSVICNTTARTSKKYAAIVVVADAVFATLEGGDYGVNNAAEGHESELSADYQDFTNSDVIPAGTVLTPHHKYFTAVTLTSGKVSPIRMA